MIKAYIIFRTSNQVSEDSWAPYTEVIEVEETDTVRDIYDKVMRNPRRIGSHKFNVELQVAKEELHGF